MSSNENLAFCPQTYDKKIRQTLPFYEEFYRQVVDVVNAYIGEEQMLQWLDVGCGTGKMAEVAFDIFHFEKFVFYDPSDEMLDIARRRFTNSNIEFRMNSIQDLKYHEQFDVITAIQVNHYLKEEERIDAIKRYYRALKRNGLFFTFENFAPFTEEGKELFLKRWKSYQLQQGKSIQECENHIARYNLSYFPITITNNLELMRKAGFRDVEIIWVSNMQVGLLGVK